MEPAARRRTTGGATSGSTTTASNTTASTSTSGRGKAGSHSTVAKAGSGPLAFAKCMRANGVTNFPDPSTGRGPLFNTAEVVTSSPAFRAAQAKCQKLMGGGLPVPGSTTHPSARTLAKLRRIAVCMRGHGVPQFPDPRTVRPIPPHRLPGNNRLRRRDPAVPRLDGFAGTRVQTRPDGVRRTAAGSPALTQALVVAVDPWRIAGRGCACGSRLGRCRPM